jgi:hypothetical protein
MLAPISVGMARKKENSVAARRDSPKSRPPMIVAPEREVPGIRASAWAKPSLMASVSDRSSIDSTRMRCSRRSQQFSFQTQAMRLLA